MPSKIQSVLFDKRLWTIRTAKSWILRHRLLPLKKPHVTKHKIRFRVDDPANFVRLRTKKTNGGIEFIIGFY